MKLAIFIVVIAIFSIHFAVAEQILKKTSSPNAENGISTDIFTEVSGGNITARASETCKGARKCFKYGKFDIASMAYFDSKKSSSYNACCSICRKTAKCWSFVWGEADGGGKACWLYGFIPQPVQLEKSSDFQAGYVDCA